MMHFKVDVELWPLFDGKVMDSARAEWVHFPKARGVHFEGHSNTMRINDLSREHRIRLDQIKDIRVELVR